MKKYTPKDLTNKTIHHYSTDPLGFWEGTKDHDVLQNITSLLKQIPGQAPYKILDFGCGPGRDLKQFKDLGHIPYGLDGCPEFCQMARDYSGCEVYEQNFLETKLPESFFDGIFANASLFHVPKDSLSQLLNTFQQSLTKEGVLFSSNPRGQGENFEGSRYGNYMELEEYQGIVESHGFSLIHHYYRPEGLPQEQCPWLACVFRKR